jgi:flagellar biosynthesis chaperone FliJ
MKPRTIARLDMLAAERETQLQDAVRHHAASLTQSQQQRQMLAAYRDRLAASWQDGEPIDAAQARRASQFATGAQNAAAQIETTEAKAAAQLDDATAALVKLKSHRRKLAGQLRAAARAAAAEAAQKAERDRPHKILPDKSAGGRRA